MLDLLGARGLRVDRGRRREHQPRGPHLLDKSCKLTTEELAERLIHAKRSVPFVQANLIESTSDDPEAVERWRQHSHEHGVWANKPVPLFPYPGSPDYTAVGGRRTTGLGARARPLPRAIRRVQRHSGRAPHRSPVSSSPARSQASAAGRCRTEVT